ncbi:mitogen-activated protein kinase-like protein MAF1 [Calycina marina]|uniref:Repressor of RNA polymerase III transcription MAF1 n=1 Tax=Calycina marina TaxID=1763456 RepID=A0A9P7ZBU8_9HELO|nr:mitogen-activated protein kinase-like protein MAF1 [Calycina marina]
MKFLPLRDFDDVDVALNFHTPDCEVIGSCSIYTTKAAGSDKKLYKDIENSLESQYESLLQLSASVSPPDDAGLNLSRASPFGPLSQTSARRTFAYLIATLNASHPDYDFSQNLRPSDFTRERSLKTIMHNIDSNLFTLRPGPGMSLQAPNTGYAASAIVPSQIWGPHMWSIIDKEMDMNKCMIYSWAPPDEPFDDDEGAIWSFHYFFFNKELKRVAYLTVHAVPVITSSCQERSRIAKRSAGGYDEGANKRARFWLGDRAENITNDEETDDYEDAGLGMWNTSDYDEHDDADDESDEQVYKGAIRGVSEDIAASMDMDD